MLELIVVALLGLIPAPDGNAIFVAQKCPVCHSIMGQGNKKGPLDDVGARLSAPQIKQWILDPEPLAAKEGKTRKPVMKPHPMPDAELVSLVAYLALLGK